MINKLFAIMLVANLVFSITAAAQTIKTNDKNGEPSPELKQAAIKLLVETSKEIGQLKAAENRVRASTIVADLLWESDETAARAVFQNTLLELQNLSGAINPPEGFEEMSRAEKSAHYSKRYALAEMRREFLLALAGRDAPAAFAALEALNVKIIDEYDPLLTDQLELEMAAVSARKSSDKSYEVAKRLFDSNGLSYQFVESLRNLYRQDSSVAARLGSDALALVKTLKIRVPLNQPNQPNQPPDPKKELDFWQLSHFITTASQINRAAERDKRKKLQPILKQTEMKELVELIANAFLAERDPTPTAISQVMTEIDARTPATAQRVRQKIGAEAAKQLDKIVESHGFYNTSSEKSVDEIFKDAERSAPDVRDQRLSAAAYKAIEEGDAEKAREIAGRIKDRKNHDYLFDVIKEALPLSKARRGDATEVDRILHTVKTDPEKARVLTELARAVAAQGDRETAKRMLDERIQLLPANPRNHAELEAIVRFAHVYSIVAPEMAFLMLENAAAQINEFIAAGIKIDEFYMAGSTESDELLFGTINKQFLEHIPDASDLIRNLARHDFDRTARFADRFQRLEIRQFVLLRVAEAVLDADATAKEKRTRERIASEQEH